MKKRGSESDTPRGGNSSTAAGSLGLLDLLSVKPGASSSSYMVLPPSHKHLSVSENTQPNQRVGHCVGTRPANKDNLSALVGSSLLLVAAAVTESCARPHKSVSAVTWWRRVTLPFTFVPGVDRQRPYSQLSMIWNNTHCG